MSSLPLADRSLWAKFKARWRSSWTVVWGQLQLFLGALAAIFAPLLSSLGDIVTSPDVKNALGSVPMPVWFGSAFAVAGLLTIILRLRRHSIDPI